MSVAEPIPGVLENDSRLLEAIRGCGASVLVAFSGGVDSSVVMKAASNALGDSALGVTARTESLTQEDLELCRDLVDQHGFRHETIEYSELEIPGYAANPVNRCYFCKSELYTRLSSFAKARGFDAVLDGSNLDDAGDYRPGLKAVAEKAVRSPLREAGLRKHDVRDLALHYGLPNHDKPSSPCLSSRVPYGSTITRGKLDQIADAERLLRSLGLSECRCRHHGDIARIEVPPAAFQLVLDRRDELVTHFRALGFRWVTLDLEGFRSGSLNRMLEQ
ncbi:ATP-dependent sacrificial sulfur transferase LarE [Candidatus Poribacteria bacterium]|nr:ATP-dependent sacrificial sulfur transferase LarE [Candidatus Poribacteria bacterium]